MGGEAASAADRENFEGLLRLLPNTAASALGVEMIDVGPERIVLTMPITDAARGPRGLLHGGISMLLAETAASMHACWGVDLNKKVALGIEISGRCDRAPGRITSGSRSQDLSRGDWQAVVYCSGD
jgi:acyl-coenzyme A thioesterase PaaI-like protein